MKPHSGSVDVLKSRRPEWVPWLAVVDEVLRESMTSKWDAAVPREMGGGERPVPLLSGTTVVIDAGAVRRLLDSLIEVAVRSRTPRMATLTAASNGAVDVSVLFSASIRQDGERVARIAEETGADTEALQAVAALVSVPFLHACQRRWSPSIPRTWMEGYCPVCGAWPAFAEVRGIERSRYLRCGRCGGEWYAYLLHCAYCGCDDHDELATLVPEKPGSPGVVEACRRCRGYLKAFTTLQGYPAATVMLQDLESTALDVAALEHGYRRPAGAGYEIAVMVSATGGARRFLAWNA